MSLSRLRICLSTCRRPHETTDITAPATYRVICLHGQCHLLVREVGGRLEQVLNGLVAGLALRHAHLRVLAQILRLQPLYLAARLWEYVFVKSCSSTIFSLSKSSNINHVNEKEPRNNRNKKPTTSLNRHTLILLVNLPHQHQVLAHLSRQRLDRLKELVQIRRHPQLGGVMARPLNSTITFQTCDIAQSATPPLRVPAHARVCHPPLDATMLSRVSCGALRRHVVPPCSCFVPQRPSSLRAGAHSCVPSRAAGLRRLHLLPLLAICV